MKTLVLCAYFIVGLLLGGYSVISNADSTPASSWVLGSQTGATSDNVCSAAFALVPASASPRIYGWTYYSPPIDSTNDGPHTATCRVKCTDASKCGSSYGVIGPWAFSGTPTETLTCPSDTTLTGRICVTNASSCDLAVGTVLYSGYYDVGTSSAGTPPSIVCKNNCVGVGYLSGPDYIAMVAGVKHYYYTGTYEIDPGTPQQNYCATDTPAQDVSNSTTAPSNTCPAGQAVGYVNGIAVCYDQPTTTTSTPPISSDKKVETTTAPDGTQTQTTTETAADGSKTVTVVVTPPEGSTAPQTTTTSKTPPADPVAAASFCQQNPNESVCKANKSECELHPGTVGCMAPGVPSDGQTINHETRSISQITAVSMPTFAANADTRTVSLLSGLTLDFSYKPLNDFALMIRPFILALAWLSAALIFIRGFND